MDDHFLVATHLSSLQLPAPSTVIIQTARQNAPLPSNIQNDLPEEHATYSFVLNTLTTGTILLRLIHGGLIVELVSLSTQVPPIRFVFPAVVLPSPSLFLWEESELHLLLVTDIGSLYRLLIPINGLKLWQDHIDNIWPREHFIQNLPPECVKNCLVHPQGAHCVAVSLPNGVMLRLEAEAMGYDGHDGMHRISSVPKHELELTLVSISLEDWTETVFQHGSFLSSLTAFLPLHSASPNASDIISLASHPWPTDIGNIWTLSRDRTLRLWKAKLGCVASKTLPTTPIKDLSSNSNSQYLLLDAEAQNLLRVFSLNSEDSVYIYVLVFIPLTSSNSGGFFCLIDTSFDQFVEVSIISCPKHTAHCHLQDFMVKDKMLYTLWDSQGQSMLDRTEIKIELNFEDAIPPSWTTHYYADQPELTPAYMEDQLSCTGSLTEIFLKNIMKPGVFSSFTLRTALDKYIEACLSLPGPPPPQLLNSHATLCEKIAAVVGSTVTLNRDPQTGGFQHANYWTALKRDWEGFVARCREVERSARWPLIIGSHGQDGVIIVERERAASLVIEDIPICLRRMLERDHSLHPQYNIFGIIWEARSKLGPRLISGLENQAVDIMHQEIGFSFAEILQDQACRIKFKDSLDEGAVDWVIGRLQSLDVDQATRTGLDSIGSFDMAVKHEQTDAELLSVVPGSPWELAQVAAYAATTIEARYELCFCLVLLLFLLSEELPTWDPSLLAEVFAVFRGVAMLRYVASQPTETPNSAERATIPSPDDVVTQMRNMNVSNINSHFASRTSVLQLLVSPSTPTDGIASTAHNFLDLGGLLQSLSPAHATKYEVTMCERLNSLRFHDVTRELLSWLPRTPAVTFLQSQVWLRLGRVDDAAYLLECLAGSFGSFSFEICPQSLTLHRYK